MGDPRENHRRYAEQMRLAEQGDETAIRFLRMFLERRAQSMDVPTLLECSKVMLDFHREWLDDQTRLN